MRSRISRLLLTPHPTSSSEPPPHVRRSGTLSPNRELHLSRICAAVASHGPLISAKFIGEASTERRRRGAQSAEPRHLIAARRALFFLPPAPTHTRLRTLNSSSAFIQGFIKNGFGSFFFLSFLSIFFSFLPPWTLLRKSKRIEMPAWETHSTEAAAA